MADRKLEKNVEKETSALKKLQAAAGFMDKPQAERLDWMYEQSAVQNQKTDVELMNMAVEAQKDKDIEDMKSLGDNTAGSLFLKSATRTSEDMMRKLREDPLFQIKRQEQAARTNMLANPLIMARIKAKTEKASKKEQKKAKKAAKKEKKALKKAAKAAKKAGKKAKKDSSSSSSSSDSDGDEVGKYAESTAASRKRGPPPDSPSLPARANDQSSDRRLGPDAHTVGKREEHDALVAQRRDAALASRGAPRRMSEEEKRERWERMKADAALHEQHKDRRIKDAEEREKTQEVLEAQMRKNSDQKYFKEIRQQAFMGDDASVADRMKSQRHRRMRNINDPLERDK